MNRRDVLTAAVGLALPRINQMPDVPHEAPWAARGRELFPTEDYGADFVAWEEWMRAKMANTYGDFDEMSMQTQIALFFVMEDMFAAPSPAVREAGE